MATTTLQIKVYHPSNGFSRLITSHKPTAMSHVTALDGAAGQPSIEQPSISTNMTTGLELEALIFAPYGIDPVAHLSKALCKPVLLECSKCNEAHPWRLPFNNLRDPRRYIKEKSWYAGWQITYDMSAQPDKDERIHVPEGSKFFCLEIVSRIINFTKPTPCILGQKYPCSGEPFEWDAQTEIFSFMQRMQEAFSSPGFCLANNKNTGLHMHFGNGEEKPPVHLSLGMFGVFATLERLFDSMLTCSRIPLLPFNGHPDCGLHRPSAVYKYDQSMNENRWVGSLSYMFLQNLRMSVNRMTSGLTDSPEDKRTQITDQLKQANVLGMLRILSRYNDVKTFVRHYPNLKGDRRRNNRYLAINLTNLYKLGIDMIAAQKYDEDDESHEDDKEEKDEAYTCQKMCCCGKWDDEDDKDDKDDGDEYVETGTVEVRLKSGTRDPLEVWAAYDFTGKLMLWLSDYRYHHINTILNMWENPDSTLLDLVKLVGASQTTIDYYTDRLSADWADRRHSRLTSAVDANDSFKAFKFAVEKNRLRDSRREAVDAKIQQKLESGYYGQVSEEVFSTLAPEIRNHPDSHVLNIDACDYERWTDKAIADHKAATIRY